MTLALFLRADVEKFLPSQAIGEYAFPNLRSGEFK
jgi:hypothetical protein